METTKRECKTCGKLYDYCHTESHGKFRWQDVACSPECGEKYFAAIMASRSKAKGATAPKAEPKKVEAAKEPVAKNDMPEAKPAKAESKPKESAPTKDEAPKAEPKKDKAPEGENKAAIDSAE